MKRLFFISLTFIMLSSCGVTEAGIYNDTYIIENSTPYTIDIKGGFIRGEHNPETIRILAGERFEKKLELQKPVKTPQEDAGSLFYSNDTLTVFFDNKRKFAYTYSFNPNVFSGPVNRNLLRHGNYIQIGKQTYKYTITNEDYQNATPCNGNCE